MKEPRSPLPDDVRRYGERADEAPPPRPEPSTATIIMAGVAVFFLLALALPAVVSIFQRPAQGAAPIPQAAPTARVDLVTPAPEASPTVAPEASPEAGPPPEALPLPATLPAGATPDDRTLTIYQGWPYRVAGRTGDGESCLLDVWPEGGPADQVWISCVLLGL